MSVGRRTIPWSQRLKAHWVLKSVGTPMIVGVFFVAYLYLLKNPVFPVTVMPLTELDRLIGFQPSAGVIYASLWVYVSLPGALLESRRQMINYARAVSLLCTAGLLIFLFWPTAIPPSGIDWDRYPAYAFLKNLDGTGNACPSLHVAVAVYSAAWLEWVLRDMGRGRAVRAASWLWCAGIVYSTLATKQHVAVDVLAGALLGTIGAVLSLQPAAGIVSRFQR